MSTSESAVVGLTAGSDGRTDRSRAVPVPDPGSDRRAGCGSDFALLTALWITMVVVVWPVGDFPINDDWAYAVSVKAMLDTGRLEVLSFSSANLGPQVYWGALFAKLFGYSYTSLRLSTLVLGLVGGFGAYLLYREVWRDRRTALLFAMCVLVNPVYFALANTFMTDVPFLALGLMAMFLIARGARLARRSTFWMGIGLALLMILQRQFAIVFLCGTALAYVALERARPKAIGAALLLLFVGLLASWAFSRWLLETGRKPEPVSSTGILLAFTSKSNWEIPNLIFSVSSYVGLFLVPIALIHLPWHAKQSDRRLGWLLVLLLTAGFGAAYWKLGFGVPVGKNVLNRWGIGPLTNWDTFAQNTNLPRTSPTVSAAWWAITAWSSLASACVIAACVRYARWLHVAGRAPAGASLRRSAASSLFFVGIAASYLGLLFLISFDFPPIDRYFLMPFIIAAFVLPFLDGASGRSVRTGPVVTTLCAAALLVSATFSVVATHDFLRWSDVRWKALNGLLARGIEIRKIDGGYEFNGTHAYDLHYVRVPGKAWWWVTDNAYQSSSGPIPGYHEVQRFPVDRWWNNGASDVIILERDQ